MTGFELGLRLAAVAAAAAILAGRSRGTESLHWTLQALFDGPVVAAVWGAALGWTVPGWLAEPFGHVLQPGLLFLACWVGLAAGCGLDLRVVRRAAAADFGAELGAVVAVIAAIFVVAYVGGRAVPEAPELGGATLFVLAALCVAGCPLPADARAFPRGGGRGRSWPPSALPALAAGLAAVGTGLAPGTAFHIDLPGPAPPWLLEVDSLPGRLLWGVGAGCMAGMVSDLATREDSTPAGVCAPIAAVVLMAAGVAATIGLEPLLVGVAAGFWLINATLRRLDILQVLWRGAVLPRLAAPFLGGWLVAAHAAGGTFDVPTFAVVLAAVLGLRPAARIGSASLVRKAAHRRRQRRPASLASDLIALDELSILVAAAFTRVLEPAAGAGALAAALLGLPVLGAATRWWAQREAPTRSG